MTNLRKRFLILGLLIVLALAVGVGLVLSARATRPPREEGVTYKVAHAYMAAMMEGDKRAALHLYRADALCSAPEPGKTVDAHIALLASSQVRNIRMDVHSADGTGYPPLPVLKAPTSGSYTSQRGCRGGAQARSWLLPARPMPMGNGLSATWAGAKHMTRETTNTE